MRDKDLVDRSREIADPGEGQSVVADGRVVGEMDKAIEFLSRSVLLLVERCESYGRSRRRLAVGALSVGVFLYLALLIVYSVLGLITFQARQVVLFCGVGLGGLGVVLVAAWVVEGRRRLREQLYEIEELRVRVLRVVRFLSQYNEHGASSPWERIKFDLVLVDAEGAIRRSARLTGHGAEISALR